MYQELIYSVILFLLIIFISISFCIYVSNKLKEKSIQHYSRIVIQRINGQTCKNKLIVILIKKNKLYIEIFPFIFLIRWMNQICALYS